jgi:hypothetical protein
MNKNKWSYSVSWTQPYNVSMNPVYQNNELTVNEEIERLNEIDDQVMLMSEYPDAEEIFQKVRNVFR